MDFPEIQLNENEAELAKAKEVSAITKDLLNRSREEHKMLCAINIWCNSIEEMHEAEKKIDELETYAKETLSKHHEFLINDNYYGEDFIIRTGINIEKRTKEMKELLEEGTVLGRGAR